MAPVRPRAIITLSILVLFTIITLYYSNLSFPTSGIVPKTSEHPAEVPIYMPLESSEPAKTPASLSPPPAETPTDTLPLPDPEPEKIPPHPKYKPVPTATPPPTLDNFPLAAAAHSAADLPPIPPWNHPPSPHVPEKTPLLIGFTRNWRLLQQTVVSYVTAGWPPEDIFVVENTGTMKSNELGLLSLQNPFFLNHTRLKMYGVNIITTPTLLSFSQMQNFFIWTAIQNNWTTYFYGHMDVIVLPYEGRYVPGADDSYDGYQTIYERAVEVLRLATSGAPDYATNSSRPWAARFFAYDRLALVNREAYEAIGGWDSAIPYYHSDCDMHDRLKIYGFDYNEPDIEIGDFFDVSASLDDLIVLYRKKETVEPSFTPPPKPEKEEEGGKGNELENSHARSEAAKSWKSETIGSEAYRKLHNVAIDLVNYKISHGRNTWQARQTGGKGEPYYRDSEGFEKSIQMLTQAGRDIYAEKWGHRACELLPWGLKAGDEWRVEHDWE